MTALARFGACFLAIFTAGVGCDGQGGGGGGEPTASTEAVDPATQAQLAALGYVDMLPIATQDLAKSGVTLHVPALAQPGYNLFSVRSDNRALLLAMDGTEVHEWHSRELPGTWQHVQLTPEGDLLVVAKDGYLARLDWNSKVLWRRDLRIHHDVARAPDGSLYILDRDVFRVPLVPGKLLAVTDFISHVSADGVREERIDLHAVFGRQMPLALARAWFQTWRRHEQVEEERDKPLDPLHTNTLEYLERDVAGLPTAGAFLICPRNLDRVAILDPTTSRIVWSWGEGVLDQPHQPTLTRQGHILIFDNGFRRGFSRVVEMDPASGEVVWSYQADPPGSFFSPRRGGVQELGNGNILVTEADRGRIFEVTRSGEIVWEFFNPDVGEYAGEMQRGAIYRMTRIEPEAVEPRLGIPRR